MTQMNLPMKQTHRCREQNYGCQWGGKAEEAWSPTGERPRFLTRSLCTNVDGGGAHTLLA